MSDRRGEIISTVHRIIGLLSAESANSKRITALFRHGASEEIGENPELFGWLIEHIPEDMQGSRGNVSKEENAIYTVLTIYPDGAKHAVNGMSIAEAARTADIGRDKLVPIEIAADISELRHPLRALLQLLRSKGISIDYGILAADIYESQWDRIKTIRKWEREYARKEKNNEA